MTTRAHVNIGLTKYWGKQSDQINLPTTNTIGLTLDNFYTETKVVIDDTLKNDVYLLDDKLLKSDKVEQVLHYFKNKYQINHFYNIQSKNFVPYAAGFASSASSFAALAAALFQVENINATTDQIAELARIGSGSAPRSILSGFTYWNGKHLEQILAPDDFSIMIIDVLLTKEQKEISSTLGMTLAQQSPDYQNWVEQTNTSSLAMIEAITDGDLPKLGQLAEANSLAMHQLNRELGTNSFDYFTEETFQVIQTVKELREQRNLPIYLTIDAGPNPKIITNSESKAVIEEFFGQKQLNFAYPLKGQGIIYE